MLDTHLSLIRDFAEGRSAVRPSWLPEETSKEDLKNMRLYLLCGDDLLESFNVPNLWDEDDVS